MAPSVVEAQPRASIEFVESSILEAVVPSDTAIDIKEELESWDGNVDDEDSSVLPSIPQRQVLLLGMRSLEAFKMRSSSYSCADV
jgi:hypothetical protein